MSALNWQPPQLLGIGHQDALWNAILTHARTTIPLSGNVYAAFEPVDAPDERTLCTHVKMGASPLAPVLFVVWRHFPFQSMLQATLSVDDLPALPKALRDALIEGMVNLIAQNALQETLENGAADIAILSTQPLSALQDKLPADLAWFDVILENIAEEPITLRIGCARNQLIAIAGSEGVKPIAIQETAKASISIPATYTLGAATFFPRQLAQLTEGAVIVLPSAPQNQQLVRVDKAVWEFHASGGAWILAGQRKRTQESQRQRVKERDVTDQVQTQKTTEALAEEGNNTPALSQSTDTPLLTETSDPVEIEVTDPATPMSEDEMAPLALTAWTRDSSEQETREETTIDADNVDEDLASSDDDVVTATSLPQDDVHTDALPVVDWVEETLVPDGVRLSDLGITIDFDIGERDFTLAEIETWQPGAVVALDPPALTDRVEVTLRANGRTIATGDLIAIDDRLAVRLSKLFLRS
ncbi:FliM/FliN family flagellar motor switch protein [Pseudochelatococcus sp. G4_1912]|uniref:FliM/FliN family flagellar motor switch protein n=1 Tax=Pseudochelatococcus sp. G4_1912 TaxID=3114288 RepID=UPI0039C6A869